MGQGRLSAGEVSLYGQDPLPGQFPPRVAFTLEIVPRGQWSLAYGRGLKPI